VVLLCVFSAFVCLCVLLLLFRHERYVALKIVKSARHYTETATDEIELLKRVKFTTGIFLPECDLCLVICKSKVI